jgi:hypothetical protein
MYINHVTLSTGDVRRSPRSEVSDDTLKLLFPWIEEATTYAAFVPLPIRELSHYAIKAFVFDLDLVVTIYGPLGPHTPGERHKGEFIPVATFAVAQSKEQGDTLWGQMTDSFQANQDCKQPETPWLAVAQYDTAAIFFDTGWLGDFERCIAWAWIEKTRRKNIYEK